MRSSSTTMWKTGASFDALNMLSLKPALPVRAGEQVALPFRLHNDQADPVTSILRSTPLLSAAGNRIEPEQLLPSADVIQTVQLLLLVPPGTPPVLPYLQLPVLLDILLSL